MKLRIALTLTFLLIPYCHAQDKPAAGQPVLPETTQPATPEQTPLMDEMEKRALQYQEDKIRLEDAQERAADMQAAADEPAADAALKTAIARQEFINSQPIHPSVIAPTDETADQTADALSQLGKTVDKTTSSLKLLTYILWASMGYAFIKAIYKGLKAMTR